MNKNTGHRMEISAHNTAAYKAAGWLPVFSPKKSKPVEVAPIVAPPVDAPSGSSL
jgi:hypothetical protein